MSEIVFNSPTTENFQTTLASLNQQVIILQKTLQEKDAEIAELKKDTKSDQTLTIVGALINLYKFIFLSGKAA